MFSLPKSVAQLPDINEGLQNSRYEQVAPSRDVTGSNFPNGMQHYKWEISGNKWWCPQKSYMRFRVSYTKADGGQLEDTDAITPAMFMLSNLYQSAEILIGDRVVGRIGQYMAEIDSLKQRMSKSKPWLDSLGELSNFASVDNAIRLSEVSSDNTEDLRGAQQLELIWTPPLNLFNQSGCLPSGKYSLRLSPENQSQYKLNSILSSANKTLGDFDFEVQNVYLYVHTIEGANVSNMTYALDLENITCQADKVQGTNLTQRYFDVSPSTVALVTAFADPVRPSG